MTDDQFDALVAKLEVEARQHPARYQTKVLLLAWIGNAYLVLMLAILALLLAGSVASIMIFKAFAIKIILVLGALLYMLMRAMWVSFDPPTGTEVTPRQAPALFEMIESIRKELDSSRFHHVLVVDHFNAAVVQQPRLGIFGWPRNYLLLGLPLMKTLTPAQFKSVLAHEFGHLAAGHGSLGNWVYCQRLRWARIIETFEANHSSASVLFKPFFKWFVPYFSAYSFPLARANEYQADATSVRLTDAHTVAQALTGTQVLDGYLDEKHWAHIFRDADNAPIPNAHPFTDLSKPLAQELDQDLTKNLLQRALLEQTRSANTHPALKDRLHAIGAEPELAPPGEGQGADQLLGSALADIETRFDQAWCSHVADAWGSRYKEVQEGRQQLAQLNARLENGETLSVDDACQRANLTDSTMRDSESALTQLRALHQTHPEHALVCYSLGMRLLEQNDDTGCALLEHTMQLDASATIPVCRALRDYHDRHQRIEQAREWDQKLLERATIETQDERDRNQLLVTDTLLPHALPAEKIDELRGQLASIAGIKKLYLVQKRVRHFPERPLYLIGFSLVTLLQRHNPARAQSVIAQIRETLTFPGETIILCVDGENKPFAKLMKNVDGGAVI